MYDSDYIARLIQLTTQFLRTKSYRLDQAINDNYIYTQINDSNDIGKETVTATPKRRADI